MKIASFSIILGFVCFTLIGFALLPLLPVKLSPSHTLPQMSVRFNMPGNASRVVEMEATSRLEAMLSRIKGVENITSTSGNGWGSISIRFDKHVDIDAARFEVSATIRQTWPHLPDGVSYPSISLNRSEEQANRPFLVFTLNAPANPIVIQQFAENNIKPKLAQIEGVDRIDVTGSLPMEWKVEYDSKQLEIAGITVNDIQSAFNHYLHREFMGMVMNEGEKNEWIRVALVSGNAGKQFHPEKIPLKTQSGRIVTLDQIAVVTYLEQEAQSYYRINGLNSIYLSIVSEENANQLNLSAQIKEKLEEIRSAFPTAYEIHSAYDATEYIRKELDKVYFRTGLTLLILLIFVLVIYRNLKYTLLIVLSLVMNLATAVIFYYWGGLEIQLYSLSGITISLTLIIDNTIVMSDQILRQNNKKAFTAILTATVTTIASLTIIFFMEEKIRLNLQDFALVIIINLSVSLLIALFLVPAIIDKLKIKPSNPGQKKTLSFGFYLWLINFLWRWRVPACILVVLLFGLPVFLLPEKLNEDNKISPFYNKTIGSEFYKEKLKPHVDKYLGGTLRLFVQKVFEGSYFSDRQETTLYITATLPNGATVAQMNHLISRMESYISQFPQVRQFQTNIQNARRAEITVRFTAESDRSGFPYLLKSKLISKSLELGGGSWSVYGLGDGFSNDVRETAGSYQVILRGYNYDELWDWAEKFKEKLLANRRIKEVIINSEFSWYKDDYQEFILKLNHENLAYEKIYPIQLFTSLKFVSGQEVYAGQIPGEYGLERIMLHSKQAKEYDVWRMAHLPGRIGENKIYKLMQLTGLEKMQAPQNIVKENQQYRLCLQYEYIGSYEQGRKGLQDNIDEFKLRLPMGYSIESQARNWNWGKDTGKQYALLLLIFIIIYFTCSILFNSLKQPLSVIFVIPISFIGIFLTFYLFKLNFDQGGFASFILLCGLSVNANIYILDEFNTIRKNNSSISSLQAYIQAFNSKIKPILLTVISTILGFIPFLVGSAKEAFWFPLAAGTIGGLIISLLGTLLFLPLFMGVAKGNDRRKTVQD